MGDISSSCRLHPRAVDSKTVGPHAHTDRWNNRLPEAWTDPDLTNSHRLRDIMQVSRELVNTCIVYFTSLHDHSTRMHSLSICRVFNTRRTLELHGERRRLHGKIKIA